MNPREFLEVADDLAMGIREGDWRSASSRAYFAAFHVARRLLRQCGFAVPQADGAHGYLWLRLSNAGHPDIKKAGNDLRHLRTYRNRADYEIDSLVMHHDAIDAVALADNFIDVLEAALSTPNIVSLITDAIRIYEREILKQVTWQP
jgi:uncharacterized protein (UPF0332 family)